MPQPWSDSQPQPHRLPRTTEPELMDDQAQALAYSEADFVAPHEAYVDELARLWTRLGKTGDVRGIALDIGCGPADVVCRVARRFPKLVIDAVDGAEAMLALGRARVAAEGFSNRVRLYRAFLPNDPLPRTGVDLVTSNSILHHLHDPQVLWTTVRRAGRPGTIVSVGDLRRPGSVDEVEWMVRTYAAGAPAVLLEDFRASLHAAFTPDEVRTQLRDAGLDQLAVRVTSDRHLVVEGVL